ncbi:MAG: calcium-binding protein [Nocardioides sp.]
MAPVLLLGVLVATLVTGAPDGSQAATPSCRGKTATIVGTSRPNVLTGTSAADVIVAGDGDDVVAGLGGNDRICGGPGADELAGGSGADQLYGDDDRLGSDESGTFLVGDILLGGTGDDLLDGGHDDRRAAARRVPDTVSWADAGSGVTVDLTTGRATGAGQDRVVLRPPYAVEGSPFADQIIGSAAGDRISGEGGADEIRSGNGNDLVFTERATLEAGTSPDRDVVDAGEGHDVVSSQLGQDEIRAGAGNDWVEAYSSAPTDVAGGAGDDEVLQNVVAARGASSAGNGGVDRITFYGTYLEELTPRPGFVVDLRGGTTHTSVAPDATGTIGGFQEHRFVGGLTWRFHGTTGDDRVWAITGGGLDAWLYAGNDRVTGSDRPDFVNGGDGTDYVAGRGGRDTCRRVERGPC